MSGLGPAGVLSPPPQAEMTFAPESTAAPRRRFRRESGLMGLVMVVLALPSQEEEYWKAGMLSRPVVPAPTAVTKDCGTTLFAMAAAAIPGATSPLASRNI